MKKNTSIATAIALAGLSAGALADTPEGWISADNPSAYTLNGLDFELNIGGIAVNDDLDILDVREDMLVGDRMLEGDSGDLSGGVIDLQVGITSFLTAFYRRQDSDMAIEVGDIQSVSLLALDDELSTETSSYGLKWNIYESGRNRGSNWTALSLELSASEGSSDDFSGTFDRIAYNDNLEIIFDTPATFQLQDIEDESWKARLVYTAPLSRSVTASIWGSYSETEASSRTGSTLTSELAPAFEQAFKIENEQFTVGASINWQLTPRMPFQIAYEYIDIQDSEQTIQANPSNLLLPVFLRADNLTATDEEANHVLSGSLSYWITSRINIGVSGKLFSNGFLGVIPHYQNPLTASFSDDPYGYAGLHLGIKL